MMTSNYMAMLQSCAEYCGLPAGVPPAPALATAQAKTLQRFLSLRLRKIHEIEFWPWAMLVEKRIFRPEYSASTAYTPGTEVYFTPSGLYYQALTATTGNAPATSIDGVAWTENSAFWAKSLTNYSASGYSATQTYSVGNQVYYQTTNLFYQCIASSTGVVPTTTANWGVLTPFNPYVAWEQTGFTALGDIIRVMTDDPRVNTAALDVEHTLSALGVECPSPAPNVVWIEHRQRPTILNGDTFSATATYTVGQQIFWATDGNLYNCIVNTTAGQSPLTTPSSWSVVQIPTIYEKYIICGAAADFLNMLEKPQRALAMQMFAEDALTDELDKLLRQQYQVRKTKVTTY